MQMFSFASKFIDIHQKKKKIEVKQINNMFVYRFFASCLTHICRAFGFQFGFAGTTCAREMEKTIPAARFTTEIFAV